MTPTLVTVNVCLEVGGEGKGKGRGRTPTAFWTNRTLVVVYNITSLTRLSVIRRWRLASRLLSFSVLTQFCCNFWDIVVRKQPSYYTSSNDLERYSRSSTMKSSTVYDRLLVTYSNHVLIYWDITTTPLMTTTDSYCIRRQSCIHSRHHFPCHSPGGSTVSRERSIARPVTDKLHVW